MSISVEEGQGKWPTAGTLGMLDEHLTDLAAYKWAASQLLSAAQRDLKHKLQNLMEQLTVSAGKNTYSMVEDHIFREKVMFQEFQEIAEVVTHLSLWRADFLEMPPSLLYCSNMTVLNLSGTSIRTLPESMPESMPKLKELYLADIQHGTDTDQRMVVPESFSRIGFPELEILDISSSLRDDDADDFEAFILPHLSFFTWFKSCTQLRELYVEDYSIDDYTDDDYTDPEAFRNNSKFYEAIQSLRELEVLSCLMSHDIHFPDDFQFSKTLKEFKYNNVNVSQVEKLSQLFRFETLVVDALDYNNDGFEIIKKAADNNISLEYWTYHGFSFDHEETHRDITRWSGKGLA
jgi:hypothetical protein